MSIKLAKELESFANLWIDGYFEGDPLDPIGQSTYGQLSYVSVLHATYLRCIRPYINSNTISLEIGPGRGAWTKTLLGSKEVYALDALPAEHNKFYEYLGHPKNVFYQQVRGFDCNFLPEDYFDFMLSFGCLCHVSFEGITKYAVNLYPKLRFGSNCFWMIADYNKYNLAIANLGRLSYWNIFLRKNNLFILNYFLKNMIRRNKPSLLSLVEDDTPSPGRWYNAGIERTCSMLESVGYRIVDPDVGTCLRDPIIHFMKS